MRFVLDAMHGALARSLRALGYDTWYAPDAEDDALLAVADRILVTRDKDLARRAQRKGLHVVYLEAGGPEQELRDLAQRLDLRPQPAAFLSRCIRCNDALVQHEGDPPTEAPARGGPFMSCPNCKRTYWAGSHVDDMRRRLGWIWSTSHGS